MAEEIVNRVEQSGLIQVNLDEHYPMGERVGIDLAKYLKEGLILIEKNSDQELMKLTGKAIPISMFTCIARQMQ